MLYLHQYLYNCQNKASRHPLPLSLSQEEPQVSPKKPISNFLEFYHAILWRFFFRPIDTTESDNYYSDVLITLWGMKKVCTLKQFSRNEA